MKSNLLDGRSQTDGTPTSLLSDDTCRLSNTCPKGISNFMGRVRSSGVPGPAEHARSAP